MTNNSDTPIKVGPCKSATMSQISKVQADTSSGSYSESSDEEPDEGYMIFIFFICFNYDAICLHLKQH